MECGIISENAGTGRPKDRNGFVTRSNLRKIVFGWGGGRNTLHCTALHTFDKIVLRIYKVEKIVGAASRGFGWNYHDKKCCEYCINIDNNIVNIVFNKEGKSVTMQKLNCFW